VGRGAALGAEVFPARSRPMALGLLRAVGRRNMLAAWTTLGGGGLELAWHNALALGRRCWASGSPVVKEPRGKEAYKSRLSFPPFFFFCSLV